VEDFSFSFLLTATPGAEGSKLVFGGVNPAYADGEFSYYPLISETYWMIQLDDVSLGENSLGQPLGGVVDTGTSAIVGPKSMIGPLI
jgi:cathepsin D